MADILEVGIHCRLGESLIKVLAFRACTYCKAGTLGTLQIDLIDESWSLTLIATHQPAAARTTATRTTAARTTAHTVASSATPLAIPIPRAVSEWIKVHVLCHFVTDKLIIKAFRPAFACKS